MPSAKAPAGIRNQVTERAKRRCEYCFAPLDYSPDPFTVEHIIARSKGGSSALENLALACFGCNNAKYDRVSGFDESTGKEVTLFNPRTDIWEHHFQWNGLEIEALTATGRITINMLKLNREPLVNLRKLLELVGLHPPTG